MTAGEFFQIVNPAPLIFAPRWRWSVQMARGGGGEGWRTGAAFLNSSKDGGDLRAAHFVGMHALQALRLLGYWVGNGGVVWGAAAGWVGVTAWLLNRALGGRPLVW